MLAVTGLSDFGSPRKSVTIAIVSPSIYHEVMGLDAMILVFWMLSFKPVFSFSSFTLIKRFFSSSSLSAIRVVSAYPRLLVFLPSTLIPACDLSSPAFLMMCSVYRLNKQSDNKQTCNIPFSILQISCSIQGSNCCFLTHIQVSQETGKMVWYSHSFKSFWQFIMNHTVKDFGIVNETEVNVFLESPRFLHDPLNVDNMISGSSSFSKLSSDIWKFLVHIMLKPSMQDF